MRRTAILMSLAALAGCTSLLGTSDGDVTVRVEASGLEVHNGQPDDIHYIAIGENALILWAPCVRADCPRIRAGATTRIAQDDIPAYRESEKVLFHWWEVRLAGGERVPGDVHTITVRP